MCTLTSVKQEQGVVADTLTKISRQVAQPVMAVKPHQISADELFNPPPVLFTLPAHHLPAVTLRPLSLGHKGAVSLLSVPRLPSHHQTGSVLCK